MDAQPTPLPRMKTPVTTTLSHRARWHRMRRLHMPCPVLPRLAVSRGSRFPRNIGWCRAGARAGEATLQQGTSRHSHGVRVVAPAVGGRVEHGARENVHQHVVALLSSVSKLTFHIPSVERFHHNGQTSQTGVESTIRHGDPDRQAGGRDWSDCGQMLAGTLLFPRTVCDEQSSGCSPPAAATRSRPGVSMTWDEAHCGQTRCQSLRSPTGRTVGVGWRLCAGVDGCLRGGTHLPVSWIHVPLHATHA